MYAVIETGGKQYRVEPGTLLEHERIAGINPGSAVTFGKVLLVVTEDGIKVGDPYLAGVSVKGKVKEEGRGDKITVFRYKSKKGYRRTRGHRQPYMRTLITAIEA